MLCPSSIARPPLGPSLGELMQLNLGEEFAGSLGVVLLSVDFLAEPRSAR